MAETLLQSKPVSYGSGAADLAFVAIVAVHAVLAAIALASGIAALASKKGGRRHRRAGGAFLGSMALTALSGIGIDVVRLSVRFAENHTSYEGMSTPSSIPARIAFLYAGACVLHSAWRGWRAVTRPRAELWVDRAAPPLLAALGIGCAALIIARLNPWTGALWMIGTFAAAVIYGARLRGRSSAEHRFHLLVLAAFSWWGAAQGFGPAIGIALFGHGAAQPYTGDRPGSFSMAFFAFLALWAPAFLLAAWLSRRYARRAA